MSFPRYPAYKDSGVEWLGEVPVHWAIKPLKHSLRLLTEKTDRRTNPVALENIESWSGRFIPTETEFAGDGVAFEANDILFGKLRPYLAKALLAGMAGEAVGDFHVMRPTNGVVPRFAQLQVLEQAFIEIVDGSTFGSKMPRASWDFIGVMPMLSPPVAEQVAIATFLDRETAKIDALVAEQEKLIELLKEKRQAVISHAVTKGLDPSVPMKDSGVEWLGEVPADWVVRRLRFISPEVTVGIVVEPSKYYVEEGVPALRSLNIKPGGMQTDNMVHISSEANELLAKSRLRTNDLVSVRSGQPGTTAVVPTELDGANCIDLIIIRESSSVLSNYLCWYMNSDAAAHQFTLGSGGAIQQHFNISNALDFLVAIPPMEEQRFISSALASQVVALDKLIGESVSVVTTLQERRSALISAAVTGQIDVRGLADRTGTPDLIAARADSTSTQGRFDSESAKQAA